MTSHRPTWSASARGLRLHRRAVQGRRRARGVSAASATAARPENAGRQDLKLLAFHPLGTARADARPSHGVVDGELELHDAAGVYVADGSVVPSALGVNPQLTIMALATRLASAIAAAETAAALAAAWARFFAARTASVSVSMSYTP